MFAHVKTVTQNDRTYEYLQILESYREGKKNRQRVVANLGRYDPDDEKVDGLVKSLARLAKRRFVGEDQVTAKELLTWGPVLLCRYLWDQVQLGQIIEGCGHSRRRGFNAAEIAFVLVANRMCEPSSEHGLARWLEHTFVCDGEGKRWEPDWLASEAISKDQRVKVAWRQLEPWYRTLDVLVAGKEKIERALYDRVCDLFSLKVDVVFYDLTTTYFSYRSPKGQLRRHGQQSKDGKPRQVQVLVGVVMANGFPIAHHIFPGNKAEKKTFREMLEDLDKRFGLNRVMVVADRGLVSPENLEALSGSSHRYLLGLADRRCAEGVKVLDGLKEDEWERVDERNQVQEVHVEDEAARYFVVESEERKAYEQDLRKQSMEAARKALETVEAAVKAGRIKKAGVIGTRAARAASRHHSQRYYTWKVPGDGEFEFFEDPQKMEAELRREGKYIIKTDDTELSGADAVAAYKQLNTVEQGFRDLKDVIQMRPIHHKTEPRIKAHLFVATLALFLKRCLEHQLNRLWPELSVNEAIAAMRSVGLAEVDLAGKTVRLVNVGGRDARRLVRTLAIPTLDPPENGRRTPM